MADEAVTLLATYLRGEPAPGLERALRQLPATVAPELVVGFVARVADRPTVVAKWGANFPAHAIRAVLAALPTLPPHPVFLLWRLAIDAELPDAALVAAWQRALAATRDLDTSYAWGSKQRRAKLAALAADPPMLAAIQAAVAHSHATSVPLDMLAVLVGEGGAASYDALVAHIDGAFATGGGRVDLLSRLRTHAARTPALDALFAEIDGSLAARNDSSPALALGPRIGIGALAMLWFDVWLGSTRKNRYNVPVVQGSIRVDSRAPIWFGASVSIVGEPSDPSRSTAFNSDADDPRCDELGLGRCAAADLPRWLASSARVLDITWGRFEPRTHLRGSKRALLVRWLEAAL